MTENVLWLLTDHVCRHCMGPILERHNRYYCGVCEATASLRPDPICGCGMRAAAGGRPLTGSLRTVFHCGPNPRRGPASPSRLCILLGDTPVDPLDVSVQQQIG